MNIDLQSGYPTLSNFLGAWFSDFDEPDSIIVASFKARSQEKQLNMLISEIEACLAIEPFPGIEIGEAANRYFTCEEEAEKWLAELLKQLR